MTTGIGKWLVAIAYMLSFLAAVQTSAQEEKKEHHHYKLIDLAPFGGPNSSWPLPNFAAVSNGGIAAASADTSTPDPTSSNFNGDAYISYGFTWQDGVFQKLDALPGFNSSTPVSISNNGHVVGISENGIDPLTGGRAWEALLWHKDGSFTDLGTLGGNSSVPNAVNNRGEVVGSALNTIPDPYTSNFAMFGATQPHAFRWTKSQGMQDLGTLGGTDSAAFYINDRGQIVGYSYTATVNPATGVPNTHPFLWENGKMTDLGTLGGSSAGPGGETLTNGNNRGDVVGVSDLARDVAAHPFLWTKSGGMQDLGTLPGGELWGFATSVNDAREVVGLSATSDALHAFLWRDGVMTDLKTVGNDPISQANSINSRGQVVGNSADANLNDLHGFLWENGSIVDLNTLIAPGSGATIYGASYINDRGEIAASGFNSNGDLRAFLLIPCDENHPNADGCDYDSLEAPTEAAVRPAQTAPASLAAASGAKLSSAEIMTRFHTLMARRTHRFGAPPTK